MSYNFRFNVLVPYAGDILGGVVLTLELSVLTMAIGLAIGFVVALANGSPRPAIRLLARAYVEAISNTPLLEQMYII